MTKGEPSLIALKLRCHYPLNSPLLMDKQDAFFLAFPVFNFPRFAMAATLAIAFWCRIAVALAGRLPVFLGGNLAASGGCGANINALPIEQFACQTF